MKRLICLWHGHEYYWLRTFDTPKGYVEALACMRCAKLTFRKQEA